MRNELLLADLIAQRAEDCPDLDVPDIRQRAPRQISAGKPRTYADLWRNGNSIAAALADRNVQTARDLP